MVWGQGQALPGRFIECAAVASRLIENLHSATEIRSIQDGEKRYGQTPLISISEFRIEPYILTNADCAMHNTLLCILV